MKYQILILVFVIGCFPHFLFLVLLLPCQTLARAFDVVRIYCVCVVVVDLLLPCLHRNNSQITFQWIFLFPPQIQPNLFPSFFRIPATSTFQHVFWSLVLMRKRGGRTMLSWAKAICRHTCQVLQVQRGLREMTFSRYNKEDVGWVGQVGVD